jgi:hypothetical protein
MRQLLVSRGCNGTATNCRVGAQEHANAILSLSAGDDTDPAISFHRKESPMKGVKIN